MKVGTVNKEIESLLMRFDELKEQKSIDVAKAYETIGNAIYPVGPYSHNIVTLCLQGIAEKYGYELSNMLVREFDLSEILDIEEHHEV